MFISNSQLMATTLHSNAIVDTTLWEFIGTIIITFDPSQWICLVDIIYFVFMQCVSIFDILSTANTELMFCLIAPLNITPGSAVWLPQSSSPGWPQLRLGSSTHDRWWSLQVGKLELVTTILTSSCKQEKQNYFCCDKTAVCRVRAHPAVTVTRSVISWKPRWQMLPARGGAVRLATGAGLNINITTGMRLLTSALSVSSEQNLQATLVIKEKVGMIFCSDIANMNNIIHTHGRYKSDIQI